MTVRNEHEFAEAVAWGIELDGPSLIEASFDVVAYSSTVVD